MVSGGWRQKRAHRHLRYVRVGGRVTIAPEDGGHDAAEAHASDGVSSSPRALVLSMLARVAERDLAEASLLGFESRLVGGIQPVRFSE